MKTQKVPVWGKQAIARFLYASAILLNLGQAAFAQLSKIRSDEEVVLDQAESDRLNRAIPANVKVLFEDEIDRNYFFDFDTREKNAPNDRMKQEVQEDRRAYERMGDFSPTAQRWFYLPHLEIPLADLEKINISPHIRESYRDLLIFKKGGREYVRYFLHPFRELQNYHGLIRKYPLVYHYVARPTSSPRSLIVLDPDNPKKPEWVKVSMHVMVTSLQRRQKLEKLARALAVNEALEAIPARVKKDLNFDWLAEPIAVKLPTKGEVIIGRDMSNYLKGREGQRLRSTFALFRGKPGEEPPVKEMLEKSGMKHLAFFTKYFIAPAVRVFAYLGFEEGIQWGMHTANYMTEQGSDGLPNGKIHIKDFDGAWFDAEIRALKGKSFENIHGMMVDPFKDFLFPSATGRNSGPRQHFGEIYNRYIRNSGGFSSLASLIYNYMAVYCREAMCRDKAALKQKVQDTVDETMIAEIKKYTGLEYTLADMKEGHLKINGLNRAVNVIRNQLLDQTKRSDADLERQDLMKAEFLRLAKASRVWSIVGGDPAKIEGRLENERLVMFWDANSGMIQGRFYASKDSEEYKIFGYALIEDVSTSAKSAKFVAAMNAKPDRRAAAQESSRVSPASARKARRCENGLERKTRRVTAMGFFDFRFVSVQFA